MVNPRAPGAFFNQTIGSQFAQFTAEPQTPEQMEVGAALADYKTALVMSHYRSWSHRFMCWLKDKEALQAEERVNLYKDAARTVVNKSMAHQEVLRQIVANQPEWVREQDQFLSLLQ